ncbi:fructose PTS transporter subunit IIA [Collinsella sp. AGMB00827]|uniref:Fructose PTS transporter subunit IIA n=1 Tax=Collinsella ureilytica TaxID=2869515 RepID=A0ABS7MKA2_9ACTN|nr:fructose PTS transporter subunit IIA [Collinsella urealyticum]MBY4797717.1 fructose PTS transporter subunit IIA [Collinsella urealyticum]
MSEFNISSVIDQDLIALNLNVCNKTEMIESLIELLVAKGKVADRQAFYDDVMWREQEGATGIGEGVAIPHGKSPAVTQTALAIGTSRSPIVWESLDDAPVSVVILFAVTDGDSDVVHLKLLQHVAKLLAHESFIRRLHAVKSRGEMLELLTLDPDVFEA